MDACGFKFIAIGHLAKGKVIVSIQQGANIPIANSSLAANKHPHQKQTLDICGSLRRFSGVL